MSWCCQATSHQLNQCWSSSMSPYGITSPQWVNAKIDMTPIAYICIGVIYLLYKHINLTHNIHPHSPQAVRGNPIQSASPHGSRSGGPIVWRYPSQCLLICGHNEACQWQRAVHHRMCTCRTNRRKHVSTLVMLNSFLQTQKYIKNFNHFSTLRSQGTVRTVKSLI